MRVKRMLVLWIFMVVCLLLGQLNTNIAHAETELPRHMVLMQGKWFGSGYDYTDMAIRYFPEEYRWDDTKLVMSELQVDGNLVTMKVDTKRAEKNGVDIGSLESVYQFELDQSTRVSRLNYKVAYEDTYTTDIMDSAGNVQKDVQLHVKVSYYFNHKEVSIGWDTFSFRYDSEIEYSGINNDIKMPERISVSSEPLVQAEPEYTIMDIIDEKHGVYKLNQYEVRFSKEDNTMTFTSSDNTYNHIFNFDPNFQHYKGSVNDGQFRCAYFGSEKASVIPGKKASKSFGEGPFRIYVGNTQETNKQEYMLLNISDDGRAEYVFPMNRLDAEVDYMHNDYDIESFHEFEGDYDGFIEGQPFKIRLEYGELSMRIYDPKDLHFVSFDDLEYVEGKKFDDGYEMSFKCKYSSEPYRLLDKVIEIKLLKKDNISYVEIRYDQKIITAFKKDFAYKDAQPYRGLLSDGDIHRGNDGSFEILEVEPGKFRARVVNLVFMEAYSGYSHWSGNVSWYGPDDYLGGESFLVIDAKESKIYGKDNNRAEGDVYLLSDGEIATYTYDGYIWVDVEPFIKLVYGDQAQMVVNEEKNLINILETHFDGLNLTERYGKDNVLSMTIAELAEKLDMLDLADIR